MLMIMIIHIQVIALLMHYFLLPMFRNFHVIICSERFLF